MDLVTVIVGSHGLERKSHESVLVAEKRGHMIHLQQSLMVDKAELK